MFACRMSMILGPITWGAVWKRLPIMLLPNFKCHDAPKAAPISRTYETARCFTDIAKHSHLHCGPVTSDAHNNPSSWSTHPSTELTQGEIAELPSGTNAGFYISKIYKTNSVSFDVTKIRNFIGDDVERVEITAQNITAPVALMLLANDVYPSCSRARKACRNGNMVIHRGALPIDDKTGKEYFDPGRSIRARVGDRVFPGDVVGIQVRMGEGSFPVMHHEKPPFDLPVVFEDDHLAIVNKPAGVVVFAARGAGHGTSTVRAALVFALNPPAPGTVSTLRRPQPVHRLDKPTTGLLIVAKTKPAMVNLCQQFKDRRVKKTYTAVVHGIPPQPVEAMINSKEAHAIGVDSDPADTHLTWYAIDYALEDKPSLTVWRLLKQTHSKNPKERYSLLELKPKTGRYHQLRRHLAWVCECPIVGDKEYDKRGANPRETPLLLCSSKVILEHPYYNTDQGRIIFNNSTTQRQLGDKENGLWVSESGKVMVTATINIPDEFYTFFSEADE